MLLKTESISVRESIMTALPLLLRLLLLGAADAELLAVALSASAFRGS
jgi:hypothetical protein